MTPANALGTLLSTHTHTRSRSLVCRLMGAGAQRCMAINRVQVHTLVHRNSPPPLLAVGAAYCRLRLLRLSAFVVADSCVCVGSFLARSATCRRLAMNRVVLLKLL